MQNYSLTIIRSLVAFLILVGVVYLAFYAYREIYPAHADAEHAVMVKLRKEGEGLEDLNFNLVDPEQAPPALRELVMLGYNIMLNTPHYVPQEEGKHISCTNCHFSGGNTTGGENNGLPLTGVAAVYPKYNPAVQKVQTLAERINNCFERSLNSHSIPYDSHEMDALLAYFQWISRGIPIYSQVSWLGIKRLKSNHVANIENGRQIYANDCAMCHGKEGQGDVNDAIPPVWGPKSFNALAGMHVEPTLAAFIYYNMPYEGTGLTEEQAIDVAAFIAQQPRPGK